MQFTLKELPNDMKFLAFIAGELPNSSHYFTTFANVNHDDAVDVSKSMEAGHWKEWSYEKRVSDAKKVEILKVKLETGKKKLAETTKRDKILTEIRSLESRQEREPLAGKAIVFAKAEPLHMKNNVCKVLFMKIFSVCTSNNNCDGSKKFKDQAEDSLFLKLIQFVRSKDGMSCNKLARSMTTWFDESKKKDRAFSFRFRGHESKRYLLRFPELVKLVLTHNLNEKEIDGLYEVFYCTLLLRQVISYSVRIENFKRIGFERMP